MALKQELKQAKEEYKQRTHKCDCRTVNTTETVAKQAQH